MEKLKQFLIDQGFTIYQGSPGRYHNQISWYAGRRLLDANPCETNNDKVSLIVWPYEAEIDGHAIRSVECEVTAEVYCIWFKLQAYSLTPEELMDQLPVVEASLLSAWNAISQ